MTFGAFTSERNVNTFWSQIISRLKSVVLDAQFFGGRMISSIFYEWAGRALECVCFIGNPFSVYFSTRCTAFTAAGASESRPCASTRIKIDGLRLVGGNQDSLTCPGTPTTTHASTTRTDSKLMYTLGGIAPIHLKPELTIAGSRRSGSAWGGARRN